MKSLPKLPSHLLLVLFLGLQRATAGNVTTIHSGNNASLICEHDRGNHFLMSTWKISLPNRPMCYVTFAVDNQTFNNCSDRIHHDVGSKQINLTIVNVTISDEGHYSCEALNETGHSTYNFTLEVLVKPFVLVKPHGWRSAECRAIGGNPVAVIEWNSTSSHQKNTTNYIESNRTTTAISIFTAKQDNETQATCIVSHPMFSNPVIRHVTIPATVIAEANILWWVCVPAAIIIVVALVTLLFWQRTNLRNLFENKKGDNSALTENPTVMVEEVEPYASFTQKVNTIYNSTNELSGTKEKSLSAEYGINKIYR
ncbi:cell surface glycoprotein CD200 receptor 1-A-like [Hyperolius riggenbachi]|uniref:cell surface glycoprotein CD200 receptor 1-A-like n=1 Tax=Hyperolius riggenbachi TaxID=752182 RepID=UPI0035A34853